jgi:diguanylate cyclase (GGDEF)-like protein/PAS domain S-box-containing protein
VVENRLKTAARGEPHSFGGASTAPADGSPDLRIAFALERRITPALFVLATLSALAAQSVAAWVALAWLAASVLNAAARFLLASAHENERVPVGPHHLAARLYAGSWAGDLVLWSLWLGVLAPAAQVVAGPLGFGAAGSVLLGAFTLGRWPSAWNLWVTGWVALSAWIVVRAGGGASPFLVAFPLWLLAAWWLGRAQHRAPAPVHDGRGRAGWIAAVQAIPSPILVLRRGKLIDVNNAAAQFLGRSPQALAGLRAEQCLRADPAVALDPMVGDRSSRSVRITPLADAAGSVPTWPARVRVLSPGRLDSAVVVALQPPAGSADSFAEDARRLIKWFGAHGGQPWYRDEAGRVVLPPQFDSAPPVDRGTHTFPLAPWVVPAERERIEAEYRAAVAQARVFDRTAHLIDRDGKARRVRLTCLTRIDGRAPAADDRGEGRAPATPTPAIGLLAPVAYGNDSAGTGVGPDWVGALPALVWWIDAAGLVEAVHGRDPWRWGMKFDAEATGVRWSEAFDFDARDRPAVLSALQRALSGTASFDVLNLRSTRSGAKLAVRSHFVPFAGRHGQAGVLVTDTIASPKQLSEIDRLRRARNHYKELVEASTSLIWACDADFNFTFVSRRAAREIYGCEQQELLGQSLLSLLDEGPDAEAARAAIAGLRERRGLRSVEMVQRARDGSRVIVSVDAAPLIANDGTFAGAIGMNANLTTLKQRERRLIEALRIERTVLDAAGQAIAVIKDGRVARCNEAFLRLLQAEPSALQRTPVGDYFASTEDWPAIMAGADAGRELDRAASREVQVIRGARAAPAGAMWCQITARWIAPGEYVLVLADIDHIRVREAEALHHAHHDDLTGLPNRRLLAVRGNAALAASGLRNSSCAVFAIDLDGFKEINDQYGHEVGDQVLREIAHRLGRLLRPQDTVARRGGDEFTMLVPDVQGRADIERIAVRLLQAIEQPVPLAAVLGVPDGAQGHLSASVGIAIAPDHGRDLDRLLQLADLAMYEAKLKGKNRYAFARTIGAAAPVSPTAPHASQAS